MADAPILPTPIQRKEAASNFAGSHSAEITQPNSVAVNPLTGGTINFNNPTGKIEELREYLKGAESQFPTSKIEELFPTQATRK